MNLPNCFVYIEDFLYDADKLFDKLLKEVDWEEKEIVLFGKRMLQPRLIAWYGDKDYMYSGTINKKKPMSETLFTLKKKVEGFTGESFNSCLANLYRDGKDSMGKHSDDEPELGPVVASISLGQERKFVIRHKHNKTKYELMLASGSLLIMKDNAQLDYTHELPKSAKLMDKRINLTFRFVN